MYILFLLRFPAISYPVEAVPDADSMPSPCVVYHLDRACQQSPSSMDGSIGGAPGNFEPPRTYSDEACRSLQVLLPLNHGQQLHLPENIMRVFWCRVCLYIRFPLRFPAISYPLEAVPDADSVPSPCVVYHLDRACQQSPSSMDCHTSSNSEKDSANDSAWTQSYH